MLRYALVPAVGRLLYGWLLLLLIAGPVRGESVDDLRVTVEPRRQVSGVESRSESGALSLARYKALVAKLEAGGNTYSPRLGEALLGLATRLRESGEYQRALDVYRRARHIARVNDGIYSLSQEPMIRAMIDIHRSTNEVERVSRQYAQLYQLYSRSYGPGDPRLLPVADEISDWHIRAYSSAPSRQGLGHLTASHNLVQGVLERTAARKGPANLQLVPLLENLAATNYLLALHHQTWGASRGEDFELRVSHNDGFPRRASREELLMQNSYYSGRQARERIADIVLSHEETSPGERAEALARRGDWHLLFGRHHAAREAYRESWQVLARPDLPEEEVAGFFQRPRVLHPVRAETESVPAPIPESEEGNYAHILVSISERGKVREVEVLETHPPDDKTLAREAVSSIRDRRFRPRLVDGSPVKTEDYLIKLYFSETP